MEAADPDKWTTDAIRTLLHLMKESIHKHEVGKVWSVGLKTLDWNKVEFDDFTAEECKAKWQEIMQKLRKIKTITELIVDAQNAIDDTNSKLKVGPTKLEFPKKPVSANALFFAENKDVFKKMKPGMNSREMMKFANDRFRELSPEKKERYLQKVHKAKEEYQENLKKHLRTHQENLMRQLDGKEKDPAFCSKRMKPTTLPGNGYNLFCREQKHCLTGIPRREITSVFSKRWKELTEEERRKYGRRCRKMKDEANRKQKNVDKKKCDENGKFLGEPKMPTRSICGLYCKSQMKELKGEIKGARNRFATSSRRSKNLSQQERDKYKAIIDKNFREYKEQLHRWFETLTPSQQQEYCEQNPKKLKYLRSERHVRTLQRTSDSEDEDLAESSSDSVSDDDVIEVIIGDEGEENSMFDLF